MTLVFEELKTSFLHLLANLEITSQKWPQNWDEIAIVVLKALSQSTPLPIQHLQLQEQSIILALKPRIEHDFIHVVHHQLQSLAEDDPIGGGNRIGLDIIDDGLGFSFPSGSVLLHDLVGEEGDGHDPAHLALMIAVDSDNHVLAFTGEDIEDDVAGTGAELDALSVEDVAGEIGRGDDDEVTLAHAEEEDVAEAAGQGGEIPMVEIVVDLEPIAEDGDGERPGRELEALAAELGDHDGHDNGDEET
ncbi:hypothetical protein IHE45_04G083000 [Dioscorea alata]|uniref:Uncharacterized protein n=1 Tax=Dioscorea alata TaxID=55571 RepID=A0ACB7WE87_DIOAL|nr:hypothetical protein IHE45_04G083000 [Dioscorea alata]